MVVPPLLLKSEKVHDGFILLRKDTLRWQSGRETIYDIVTAKSAAIILAITKKDEVVMTQQYRHAINKVLHELPAGLVEQDEDPQDAAKRELQEETGYTAARWQHMGTYAPISGFTDMWFHLFLAQDLQIGKPTETEGEELDVELVPYKTVLANVERNVYPTASIPLAILYYQRLLRQK